MIEDAEATVAYQCTRDGERMPIGVVDQLAAWVLRRLPSARDRYRLPLAD